MATDAYDHGAFCWADLATSDADGAKTFYAAFFGWGREDRDMGGDGVYTLLDLNGQYVAGLMSLCEDEQNQGIPPHWNAYVAVDSCEETVRRAQDLGGTVLVAPFDIPDAGRMAVIRDPQGAVLALWQRDSAHAGAAKFGPVPGSVCWTELATTDAAAAEAFYTALFGWKSKDSSIPGVTYTEFVIGERPAAGMLQMTEEWGGAPPHWLVYFAITDCDHAAAQAGELGGAVIKEPFDIANVGRIAVLADPHGAVFAIIAPAEKA